MGTRTGATRGCDCGRERDGGGEHPSRLHERQPRRRRFTSGKGSAVIRRLRFTRREGCPRNRQSVTRRSRRRSCSSLRSPARGLSPHGFYEVNQSRDLDGIVSIDNGLMAMLAAAAIFVLYVSVYLVVYRYFRVKVEHLAPEDPIPRFVSGRAVVIGVVVGTL